jgi:hypothetical protein
VFEHVSKRAPAGEPGEQHGGERVPGAHSPGSLDPRRGGREHLAVEDGHDAAGAALDAHEAKEAGEGRRRSLRRFAGKRIRLVLIEQENRGRARCVEEAFPPETVEQRRGSTVDRDPGRIGLVERRASGRLGVLVEEGVARHQDGARLERVRQVGGCEAGVRTTLGDDGASKRQNDTGGRLVVDR